MKKFKDTGHEAIDQIIVQGNLQARPTNGSKVKAIEFDQYQPDFGPDITLPFDVTYIHMKTTCIKGVSGCEQQAIVDELIRVCQCAISAYLGLEVNKT